MSYAQVNGVNLYYETHGTGRPLVLLHGNLSTIDVDFGAMIPNFAKNRQVIAIEHQAHGHTADIDRPLTVQNWADDAAALLRHLGVEGTDVFGYSSGSAVALQVALDHPELVRKLVLAEITYTLDGVHPGMLDGIQDLQPEHLEGTPFAEAYARVAPRPQDFPVLVSKIKEMDSDLPEWTAEAIKNLGKPTLLLYGDSGIARPEHMAELFRLLGGGVMGDMAGLPDSRLAVLPATTHVSIVQRVDWLVPMVEEFLEV
jgi:pimeloyl-ACP methyl ester carboxylesterase